jgi:hypothetical protein
MTTLHIEASATIPQPHTRWRDFEVSARLDALTTRRVGPKMSRPFGEADATMDGAGRALIDDRSMEILA